MLHELRVHDFVLIDSLTLRLDRGFNVLTGETGAGKSIVVGALSLALGGRARADVVRQGADEATVEALFDVSRSPGAAAQLAAMGIGCDDELVIRRAVQSGGRSRAYLNGRLCTAGELAALAPELADITSQHESVALVDPRRHLGYLDRYAGHDGRKAGLAGVVDELAALSAELAEIGRRESSRAEREDFLRYRLEVFRRLSPRAGETDELRLELGRLKHAERLRATSAHVADEIEGDGGGLCDRLGKLAGELSAAAQLDPGLEPLAAELESSWERLREVARTCARYAENIESDPARLESLGDRLFQIESLMRQHGPTLEDALAAADRMEAELVELAHIDVRLPALENTRIELLGRAGRVARQLSRARKRAAAKLAAAITEQLDQLGMGAARVSVEVTPAVGGGDGALAVDGARLGRDGIDRVQFLIAPSSGVEPRPLGRIASGGELSRALLALKRALGAVEQDRDAIEIFDEVDAGVGGATADRIGRAMLAIAEEGAGRQVLCITHLASIAAYADAHFVVERSEGEDPGAAGHPHPGPAGHPHPGTATSKIGRVDGAARIAELARMLTGTRAAASSAKAARELLECARRRAA